MRIADVCTGACWRSFGSWSGLPLSLDDLDNVMMWQSFLKVFTELQFERLRSYLIARKPTRSSVIRS